MSIEEVLKVSDYVTIHMPLNDETRNLFNAKSIAEMKDDAIVLNMARGGIVNEKDMYEALKAGKIGGYASDVMENELAAGGLTGLATIIAELGRRSGINLPVGMQTIVMNALLLLVVVRAGGLRYALQTVTGFVFFGFFTDLFAPFVLPLDAADLTLSALWGGIISGLGYGLVFRCGANTGGSDTIGQIIARKSSLPVGATVMAIDVAVCAASAPVFSLTNALYAALAWWSWATWWTWW